jgi:hypothetical protein
MNGHTLSVKSAISVVLQGHQANGGDARELWVVLADYGNACQIAGEGGNKANSTTLVVTAGAGGSAVPPGTYSVETSTVPSASGNFTALGAGCDPLAGGYASGGTVTVTSISASSASGTFDLSFPADCPECPKGHLTGSFNAPTCSGLLTTNGASCVP